MLDGPEAAAFLWMILVAAGLPVSSACEGARGATAGERAANAGL